MPIEIVRTATNRESEKSLPQRLIDCGWLPGSSANGGRTPGSSRLRRPGQWGLLLTLVIVIQGGIELLNETPAGDELTDNFAADLGEPAEATSENLAGLFDEGSGRIRPLERLTDNERTGHRLGRDASSPRQIAAGRSISGKIGKAMTAKAAADSEPLSNAR